MAKNFEGYSDFFLRLVVKVEELEEGEKKIYKTDTTGKDYYQILGLDASDLLGKEIKFTLKKEREELKKDHTKNELGYNLDKRNIDAYLNLLRGEGKEVRKEGSEKIIETYWLEKVSNEGNDVYTEIKNAHKKKAIQTHPDRGGTAEGYKLVGEAFSVLRNSETKKQYDKFYRIITGGKPDVKFKEMVIQKLLRLSQRTEEAEGIQTPDSTGTGTVGGEDISGYIHLFPSNVIHGNVNGGKTKAGISRYANRVIHIYQLLRSLEDEVNGSARASINTKRQKIEPSRLGAYANFRKSIWGCKSKDAVVDYDGRVRKKIREVIHGKVSANLYDWEDAQEENFEILRGLEGWDNLSGPENQQGTEKFHFVTGFSRENFGSTAEPGITSLRFDNPNHPAYRQVIEQAKVFLAIKKKIDEESDRFSSLRDRKGGNVNQLIFTELRSELENLGKLKKVESAEGTGGKDFAFTITEMKFKSVDDRLLQEKIRDVFRRFADEVGRVGARPLEKGDSSGGSGGSGEPWRDAIQEIENALRETGLKSEEGRILGSLIWRSKFTYELRNDSAGINRWRTDWLGLIYRVAARRKITQELGINSVSINQILGPGRDIKEHFIRFNDKASINAERDHLLALIADYGKGRGGKIEAAVAAVEKCLQDNQLKKDSAKIEQILGKDWERQFVGLSNEVNINQIRDKFIQKIKDFVARDKNSVLAAIQEIENLLTISNLSESILGPNWKDCFQGKNESEMIAELGRLKKIIVANGGKIPEVISASKTSSINRIKNKLKEGHQKLVVREEELPSQLLVPHKTVEEKINSLENLEDITAFENELREVIIQKKQEKLTAFANEAIAEIEKEIGQDQSWIELGENRDYKAKLKSATDPDFIDLIKQNVIKLIREQKGNKMGEEFFENPDSNDSSFFNPETIGIIALIILPLALVGFVALRLWQRKSRQRRFEGR